MAASSHHGRAAIDKLKPHDPRAKKTFTEVNGRRWHYLDAAPQSPQKGTIFLIHGFPDLSFAWRYQIPLLASLGFRCIALDCMGYGSTGTSSDLTDFSFKAHADAIAGIAKAQNISKAIIGGHDWGGLTVFRVAQWYPDLITHVFSVCTAYVPPTEKYVSAKELAEGLVPQFGYQLQFGSEDHVVEKVVCDESRIRKFLTGTFGGKSQSGKPLLISPEKGVDLKLIEDEEFGMTPLMDQEELDFYVSEFTKNGMNGPLNWYRTRYVNWEEEKALPKETRRQIKQPTLHIQALRDNILKPELTIGMERNVPNLTRGSVPASHWALWQTADKTNAIIKEWIEGLVLGGKSKL